MTPNASSTELGLTRKVLVTDEEILDFLKFLFAVQNPQTGEQRKTKDFDDRKRTRTLLKQLGGYDAYLKMTSKLGNQLLLADVGTVPRLIEISVESIDYFLTQVTGKEIAITEAMRICDLEERLSDAKVGLYRLAEPAAAPPVPVDQNTSI